MVAQVQGAVLRFRSAGVDRVFIEGVPTVFFANEAQAQSWHPHYVVTSATGGAALEANLPKEQLANFHGYGWFPAVDVNRANQPPLNAQQKLCLQMLKSQGIVPSQYNDFLEAYTTCDSLFLYDRALRATNGNPAVAMVARVLERFDGAFTGSSTLSGRTVFKPNRHDAPATWRPWTYQGACSCFRYSGSEHSMPDL